MLVGCLPLLVDHLVAKSHVVHSYAANCLDKLFTLKSPGGGAPYVLLTSGPFTFRFVINYIAVLSLTLLKQILF